MLLRLEHIYQNNEDSDFSKPVSVDLGTLFARFSISAIEELKLAANVETNKGGSSTTASDLGSKNKGNFIVELKPMEIKSLRIHID